MQQQPQAHARERPVVAPDTLHRAAPAQQQSRQLAPQARLVVLQAAVEQLHPPHRAFGRATARGALEDVVEHRAAHAGLLSGIQYQRVVVVREQQGHAACLLVDFLDLHHQPGDVVIAHGRSHGRRHTHEHQHAIDAAEHHHQHQQVGQGVQVQAEFQPGMQRGHHDGRQPQIDMR